MISNDALRNLVNKYQTTELNVRREYVQHLFLSYFYRQSASGRIYFKGGTALRLLFNSPRFSEDLDFSSSVTGTHSIEEAVLEALVAVERENIQTDLQESKKTSGGYLAVISFQLGNRAVSLQLEISHRAGRRRGEVATIASDYVPAFAVVALTREELVDEKIQALLAREKARDFYDLYFILRANLLPAKKKAILRQVLETLKHTTVNFERELKQFLPKSHWAQIRGFPETLEREIERFL
jgi:predicted nucleotidyltransferase component of viral defense system